MTPEERQAMRKKHRPRWDEGTPRGEYECLECDKPYPCDVIKVLVECTHIIGLMTLPKGWDVIEHGQTDFAFTYCPKCGEKL